jgi:hypothetical protein
MGLFGLDHMHEGDEGRRGFTFEITDLVFDEEEVAVAIEPFDLLVPRIATVPTLRRSGNISVQSLEVELQQRES